MTPAGSDSQDEVLQLMKRQRGLRWTQGEDLTTQVGPEYYD
jgi:hypothetical protein